MFKRNQRFEAENHSKNSRVFSLPSLSTHQVSRINQIQSNDRYLKTSKKISLSNIKRPSKNDSLDVARCSALFLTKHVRSLNRKESNQNSYHFANKKMSYLQSSNPSFTQHRKSFVLSESPKGGKNVIASTGHQSTHKYALEQKEKLQKELGYNPLETVQNFMKKIEKNEYYKSRVYDKDIYMEATQIDGQKSGRNNGESSSQAIHNFHSGLRKEIDDMLDCNKDELNYLRQKLKIG